MNKSSPTSRSIITNSIWLLTDKILRIGVSAVLGIMIIRYLGPELYGQYAYSLAVVGMFGIIISFGIEQIVIRDLSKNANDKTFTHEILGSALGIRVIGNIVFSLIIAAVIMLSSETMPIKSLIVIFSIGYFFQIGDVIDYWYQSKIQSKYVVISKIITLIFIVIYKVLLLIKGASLQQFAIAYSLEFVLNSGILVATYHWSGQRISAWRINKIYILNTIKNSIPIIISSAMVYIYMRIDQIMLRYLSNTVEIGKYAAVIQLSEIWYFIPTIIVSSMFPYIARMKDSDKASYLKTWKQLFLVLAISAYAVIIPTLLLAKPAITLLYGDAYAGTELILQIHIMSLLFVSMGVGQSCWQVSEEKTSMALSRTSLGALSNIALNILLLPKLGAVGAAIATLISQFLAGFLLNTIDKRTIFLARVQLNSIYLNKLNFSILPKYLYDVRTYIPYWHDKEKL